MSEKSKTLSHRHARFVAEYLKDLNGTQAYIRAGYAPHSAQVSASKLLRHPQVQAVIDEAYRQTTESWKVTGEPIARAFITLDADGRLHIDPSKADKAKRSGPVEISITDYAEARPQRMTIVWSSPRKPRDGPD